MSHCKIENATDLKSGNSQVQCNSHFVPKSGEIISCFTLIKKYYCRTHVINYCLLVLTTFFIAFN